MVKYMIVDVEAGAKPGGGGKAATPVSGVMTEFGSSLD
jgi:hypothetical protein